MDNNNSKMDNNNYKMDNNNYKMNNNEKNNEFVTPVGLEIPVDLVEKLAKMEKVDEIDMLKKIFSVCDRMDMWKKP